MNITKRNNIIIIDDDKNQPKEDIIIKANHCIECGKSALYNIPPETRGIYCLQHKTPEMLNAQCSMLKTNDHV
jgi:hypothetical protein